MTDLPSIIWELTFTLLNVNTKKGSGAIVEFAIKMPNKNDFEKTLWLPIDSKFPKEDYERLVDAYDDGDPNAIRGLQCISEGSDLYLTIPI